MKTRDGHSLDSIAVTAVYFVPRGREPLADWRDRIAYYCRRMEQFHAREFVGQSKLLTTIHPEPLRSARSSSELRIGDPTFTFLQTVGEAEKAVGFRAGEGFPVLLVFSDINWGEVDDFYRLHGSTFAGKIKHGRHHPGTPLGGSSATYVGGRGVGLALVSADGWRVPYTGSDCVAYHETAHAFGVPHPAERDETVMSEAQYLGWLNETRIGDREKLALGWQRDRVNRNDLFSSLTATIDPPVPKPGEMVTLKLSQEVHGEVAWQTALDGPWTTRAIFGESLALDAFSAPTPVSYRVRADDVELWGYFQVRERAELAPQPPEPFTVPPRREVENLLTATLQNLSGRKVIERELPAAYALLLVVTPREDNAGLVVGLHQGGKPYPVELPATWFVKDRPIAIVCGVRGGGVLVTCEGETLTARTPARDEPDGTPFYLEATGTLAVSTLAIVPYG
ncbi:MAG: hypothetical protein AB7T06_15725 [Kofleriaceae bacterium]